MEVSGNELPAAQLKQKRRVFFGNPNYLALALVTLFCFLVTFVMFFPGLADNDTGGIIGDAEYGSYQNWHSVFAIFMLRQIRSIIHVSNGYYIWFLATMIQFWLALGTIAAYHAKGILKQGCFLIIAGFFPASFFLLLANTKDSLMCATLLLSYAFILIARFNVKKLVIVLALILAMIFLFAACGERHNATFACLPLLVWLSSVALKKTGKFRRIRQNRLKIVAVGLALLAVIFSARYVFEKELLIVQETYPLQVLLTWDLVNMSVSSQEVLLPNLYPDLKVPLNLDYLKKIYCECDASCLYWWPLVEGTPTLKLLSNREDINVLGKYWLTAIIRHPLKYMTHRMMSFMSALAIAYPNWQAHPYEDLIHAPDYDDSKPSIPFRTHSRFLNQLHSLLPFPTFITLPYWIFRGWPYLLLLAGIYALFVFKQIRLKASEYFLAQSALLYTASFLAGGVSNNQRYMLYLIVVSIILLLTILLGMKTRIIACRKIKSGKTQMT